MADSIASFAARVRQLLQQAGVSKDSIRKKEEEAKAAAAHPGQVMADWAHRNFHPSDATAAKAKAFVEKLQSTGKKAEERVGNMTPGSLGGIGVVTGGPTVKEATRAVYAAAEKPMRAIQTGIGHLPVVGPKYQDARLGWMEEELERRRASEAAKRALEPVEGGELDDEPRQPVSMSREFPSTPQGEADKAKYSADKARETARKVSK